MSVQVALVAREGDDKQSVFEGLTAAASFSHHQARLAETAGHAVGRAVRLI